VFAVTVFPALRMAFSTVTAGLGVSPDAAFATAYQRWCGAPSTLGGRSRRHTPAHTRERDAHQDRAAPPDHAKEEDVMPLIEVKVLEGVFSAEQKQRMVEELTGAMVNIEGENMRGVTTVIVEEIHSGSWGIGGR
jgi:4-oxalocrotonate tautomerase